MSRDGVWNAAFWYGLTIALATASTLFLDSGPVEWFLAFALGIACGFASYRFPLERIVAKARWIRRAQPSPYSDHSVPRESHVPNESHP